MKWFLKNGSYFNTSRYLGHFIRMHIAPCTCLPSSRSLLAPRCRRHTPVHAAPSRVFSAILWGFCSATTKKTDDVMLGSTSENFLGDPAVRISINGGYPNMVFSIRENPILEMDDDWYPHLWSFMEHHRVSVSASQACRWDQHPKKIRPIPTRKRLRLIFRETHGHQQFNLEAMANEPICGMFNGESEVLNFQNGFWRPIFCQREDPRGVA